jgi:hypothetical protein
MLPPALRVLLVVQIVYCIIYSYTVVVNTRQADTLLLLGDSFLGSLHAAKVLTQREVCVSIRTDRVTALLWQLALHKVTNDDRQLLGVPHALARVKTFGKPQRRLIIVDRSAEIAHEPCRQLRRVQGGVDGNH